MVRSASGPSGLPTPPAGRSPPSPSDQTISRPPQSHPPPYGSPSRTGSISRAEVRSATERYPCRRSSWKKPVDDVQLAGADDLVVDVLARREVEHSEAEGREHHRPVRQYRHPPDHHVTQRAIQEIPVARKLFGQMRRGVGLDAVLDVVDDAEALGMPAA